MPRLPRIHVEEELYYITTRGDNNQTIFKDKEDFKTYIGLLKKYKEQYGFKLFSFSLLCNHLHLLIELTSGVTISDIMHDINNTYIKYFNSRYNRGGHLLQERFRMVLVEKKSYLAYMTAYIHRNPYHLGLSSEAKDYKYTSLPLYLKDESLENEGFNEPDINEEIKEVEIALSEISPAQDYKQFFENPPQKEFDNLVKKIKSARLLGSDAFKDKIKRKIAESKQKPQLLSPEVNKKFVLAGTLAIAILGLVNIALMGTNRHLKGEFTDLSQKQEKEYSKKLTTEKERIKRGLDELYRANMVSYEAMSKRLEAEKQKVKELEGKLGK
ncbi:MAG: transposase [Candidatus Omnitrophica bacterium]|nr:transposase [Candidatus Omnitrophota bacterium]